VKRRAVLITTITCLLLSIHGYTQRITFSQDNAPLTVIFASIEKQTSYNFLYDIPVLQRAARVSLHVVNAPLSEVLAICEKNQPFTFEIVNTTIGLREKPNFKEPPRPPAFVTVKGKVVNETGAPLASATVYTQSSNKYATTNENGEFTLDNVLENDSLTISTVSYSLERIKVQGNKNLVVTLKAIVSELSEVVVSNGYQKQSIEKATGSYVKIGNDLFNRSVSTDVIGRLDGITSGLLFNKNIQSGTYQSAISIRGRSTIFANPEPLIVLDNFPYTGDPNNINPNDVESITVLKDAAAASIWGAYAANGVVVIITKAGKYNQPLQLSFNSNVTIGSRPDLYYQPQLSSSELIEVEQFLFSNGYYNEREGNQLYIPPAVEIMIKKRNGDLSSTDTSMLLNALRRRDNRNDQKRYFYRNTVNQQYAISAHGGGTYNQYYFSAGYDKNLSNTVGNEYNRITLNANNTYAWFDRKLELTTGIIFSASTVQNSNYGQINIKYPYEQLIGANNTAYPTVQDYRQPYVDTAGQGKLLDWQYRPVDEVGLADNKTNLTDYRINIGLKYQVLNDLSAAVLYQYNKGISDQQNLHSQQTYFTRNLINQFTQINGTSITRPIPLGDILDKSMQNYSAHNFRAQINYQHSWNKKHALNIIGGAEIRRFDNQSSATRLYGYNEDRQTHAIVDYNTDLPAYQAPSTLQRIPYKDKDKFLKDRFVSYYANAAYTFYKRYILSASIRKDESNIFGVKTNQKGVPLWSAGLAWEINKEKFYHAQNWLPYLKLRITHGYNGNVDRTVSAFTSATIDGTNTWGATTASILNPPNPALRWEKVQMTNIGLDFGTLHNVITGSIEYYIRKSTDLIGNSPLDPTTGTSTFRGNTANMKGHGIDITLATQNIRGKVFNWTSNLFFSYTTNKVTEYKAKQATVGNYLRTEQLSPLEGNPLYTLYSIRWEGLDALSGDPLGLLNGSSSKDYGAILSSSNLNDLQKMGSQVPTFFGSLRNNFSWKQLQLSFNITWKAGYYFRAPSIQYYNLFTERTIGHADFTNRWQKPGDENHTQVPSMTLVNNSSRDLFYSYSSLLVEPGDHIRLQDVQLNYEINKKVFNKSPIQRLKIYAYINNIGLLWKANDRGIDPDYISGIPLPRSIAIGINVDLK
jgi:TonB-linked SusC/RagA family outer membrane protein